MAGQKRGARGGRKAHLTLDLANKIADWHESVQNLGTLKEYLKKAREEWTKQRRALGFAKRIAAEHGLSGHQVTHARHRRYKRCK